jgi:hypothetical protein
MPSEAASMNCLQFENPANYRWAHRHCGLTMHMHWVVTFQAPHCFRLLQSTLCDRQRDLGAGQWAHRCICVRSRDRWHTGRGLQVPEGGYNTGHCPAVSRGLIVEAHFPLPCSSLQEREPSVKVFLIDPPGSSLYNKAGGVCCGQSTECSACSADVGTCPPAG